MVALAPHLHHTVSGGYREDREPGPDRLVRELVPARVEEPDRVDPLGVAGPGVRHLRDPRCALDPGEQPGLLLEVDLPGILRERRNREECARCIGEVYLVMGDHGQARRSLDEGVYLAPRIDVNVVTGEDAPALRSECPDHGPVKI